MKSLKSLKTLSVVVALLMVSTFTSEAKAQFEPGEEEFWAQLEVVQMSWDEMSLAKMAAEDEQIFGTLAARLEAWAAWLTCTDPVKLAEGNILWNFADAHDQQGTVELVQGQFDEFFGEVALAVADNALLQIPPDYFAATAALFDAEMHFNNAKDDYILAEGNFSSATGLFDRARDKYLEGSPPGP